MTRRRLERFAAAAVTAVVLSAAGRAAPAPAPASAVVAGAVTTAKSSGRHVLIEFGASWCVWCRNFQAFVQSPDAGPVIAANFVVVNLVVRESDDKKALENPGGDVLMEQWGGAKSGLPFYVFLDDSGHEIADSNAMPGNANIGFPAVPKEIDAFMGLIDRTAPKLTPAGRATLAAYLTRVR